MKRPITKDEVMAGMQKLKNNRASGKDQIAGELLKYGGEELAEGLAAGYNRIFETHSSMDIIGEGLLMPLNKANKPKTADNTRAITLLNTRRKLC